MTAVYYGRRSVGEFSQCGRHAVAIAHGSHEVDEGISLRGMVGQQPDGIEHLDEAAFHPLKEFSCFGRRIRIVFSQRRNSSHLQSPSRASHGLHKVIISRSRISRNLLESFLPPESYRQWRGGIQCLQP